MARMQQVQQVRSSSSGRALAMELAANSKASANTIVRWMRGGTRARLFITELNLYQH
jgi:hypothetical protein